MKLIIDTLEQNPLEFIKTDGVEIVRQRMQVGDYTAIHGETPDDTVIERKSVADLFNSFTNNYDAERDKIIRANVRGLKYILAIEASASEVRKGHSYRKDGEVVESKKSGIAQLRQLMTVSRKYKVEVWFCESRSDMALRILEYFLAHERVT